MVKRYLIIFGSICSILILIAIGYNYCDQDVFSRKDDVAFYSNLNIFNYFRFRKSTWDSGEPQELRWKAKNVFCKDGKMVLKLCNEEPKLTGGEVCTKRTFGFGLYQVRMKPIKNTGVVSAFFTYDKVGDEGTEIDIEFLGYDTTKVQFNYFTNGVGGHEYLYDLGFDASEEFHEYAFNWTEDSIQWFVDGELAYEVQGEDIPQMKAKIMMDVWAGDKPGWLKEYDGASPLYAYYDWVSYKELKN